MQNITLLKEQTTNTEPPSLTELRLTLKQKSIMANKLHNQIQNHRKQIKQLSDSVSKYIQKKLKPNTVKERPKLFRQYKSARLNQLQQQKNKIYRQISEVKQLIKQIKNQEQPQTITQYLKKQNTLKDVLGNLQESEENKKYLIHELNQNKQKIFELNDNGNIKSTTQNQKLLQQLRKQFKIYDKQAYYLDNEQIIHNMFYFQLKNALQKTNQPIKQLKTIDYGLISKKINQINEILQERNRVQKQNNHKLSQLTSKINQLNEQNKRIQHFIRDLQGKQLRKNMQQRFYRSKNSKSTSQIKKTQKSYQLINEKMYNSNIKTKRVNTPKDVQFLTQIQDTDLNQQILQIGDVSLNEWSTRLVDQIDDDRKINRITFLYNKKNIVGIKASYSTKKGLREGKMHTIKNLQSFAQVDLNVKDIQSISYQKSGKNMFIIFNKYQGTKQSFGLQYINLPFRTVSIQNKFIKTIQIIVQNKQQNSRIKGIKIQILKKTQSFIPNSTQIVNQIHYQQNKAKSVADLRSSKVSSNSSHFNRKIVLGGLKKINQPKMDHRLLIGRKKLV